MEFANRVAVVTGASSGIGRATALMCAQRGGAVLATGRDDGALAEVVSQIEAAGGQARACAVDLTSDEGPGRVVAAAVEAFGGIDVLVNAAGIIANAAVDQTSDALWDRVMALNVRAPFRLIREAAPTT
jgi:3-oxoacyl-[acyl-carrier protein] reductase